LKAATPVYPYAPHTWGPDQVDPKLRPPCGWDDPRAEETSDFRVVAQTA
jgi:glucose-6-phosphate 1-dehydrogenase